jgi:hypothetical protein
MRLAFVVPRALPLLLGLTALAPSVTSCTSPATAVVVVMDSNVPPERPMVVTVRTGTSDEATMWSTSIWARGVSSRGGALSFPSSFTVVPKAGAERASSAVVWFDVELLPGAGILETQRFSRRVRFSFTPGQTTRARVFIAAECGNFATDCPPSEPRCSVGRSCELRGLTCGEGGRCESPQVDTTPFDRDVEFVFPDVSRPVPQPDGGMDSGVPDASETDASVPDALPSDAPNAPDSADDASDSATAPEDAMRTPADSGACAPMCAGRECGDDTCRGSCGSCPPRSNSVPTCSAAGRCSYACATGFGDCDGNAANGCETALNSTMNCGACGRACSGATPVCNAMTGMCSTGCGAGQTRCAMSCVDTNTDVGNCGSCGRSCSLPNAVAGCSAGGCVVASCNAGFANCDGNAANGCETPLNTAMNCGACGRACSGATPVCNAMTGMCSSGCSAGQTRCGMSCVDTSADVGNCGSCGNVCAARANSVAACSAGACRYTCTAGFGDCDGNAANGCETPLNSTMNCGACGRGCSYANGSASCTAGACALAGCTTGFGDCDGSAANGCETPLNSTTHCGMCGRGCSVANGSATCASGTCQVASCSAGFGNCDGSAANGCETNTTNNSAHCSACGNACTSRANASTSCASSACGFTCNSGFENCNGNGADGCETNLGTTSNCGMCGRSCSYANASASCTAGSCAIGACNAGFGNCDGNAANGCETPLNTTSNCGGCGTMCARTNAAATCAGGTCAIGVCNTGFANCDGGDANGCETNTSTNNSNCGGCGVTCPANRHCSGGGCVCNGFSGCGGTNRCCEPDEATCTCAICVCSTCACP